MIIVWLDGSWCPGMNGRSSPVDRKFDRDVDPG